MKTLKLSNAWNDAKVAKRQPTHLSLDSIVFDELPRRLGNFELVEFSASHCTFPSMAELGCDFAGDETLRMLGEALLEQKTPNAASQTCSRQPTGQTGRSATRPQPRSKLPTPTHC